ncbi:DUF47 domain-containing protein [Pedobacter sp. Leaf132]|uniref:DUF47 domain-containing protein n=1 Tax=Pedobacter sp. Leaf132 TaxID=2876557 RepID=UPI001E50E502|nr:DUF47 family protein [Pedobacter sp. Leaf132]
MNQIFSLFIPKDRTFQPLFETGAKNLINISEALVLYLRSKDQSVKDRLSKEIKNMEAVGDKATNTIYDELNNNFIVPFDKQDVHALATSIDDIADEILSILTKIELYQLIDFKEPIVKFAEIICKMCTILSVSINEIKDFKNKQIIIDICTDIKQLENKADRLYEQSISILFESEFDAITLIRQSEVLALFEKTADKCGDLAITIETIFLKNA